ncbi:MAG: CDP-alcohol phosphatidyltransferase family protein [Chloroflexi bacterium]|nr:MAG: CDP-alcohol phosphatidyltransferase family protein [Chloroflexota bacterium]
MANQQPTTFSQRLRSLTAGFMSRVGMTLHRAGIHPDMVTVTGLVFVAVAAFFIAQGDLQIGGIVLLLSLPLDAIDGAVARAMQRKGKFGAMLDSALDRYADGLIFGALSYYFAVQDRFGWMLLALLALMGSYMVSYIRGRAGGLRVDVEVGLFTRLERIIVILIMLLIPTLLEIGVVILAVGTNFTAGQRLWHVYKVLKEREDS